MFDLSIFRRTLGQSAAFCRLLAPLTALGAEGGTLHGTV